MVECGKGEHGEEALRIAGGEEDTRRIEAEEDVGDQGEYVRAWLAIAKRTGQLEQVDVGREKEEHVERNADRGEQGCVVERGEQRERASHEANGERIEGKEGRAVLVDVAVLGDVQKVLAVPVSEAANKPVLPAVLLVAVVCRCCRCCRRRIECVRLVVVNGIVDNNLQTDRLDKI